MTTPDPLRTPPRILPANQYRRERWRNGHGWTREIHAAAQAGRADWDWRLSIAEIERDAPFSAFPGVERELVLLNGNGLRLCFADGESRELSPPHGRLRFAGERAVVGELVDGRTEDFNLMWRRARCDARLWHRPLVGPMVCFTDPGSVWIVHLLAGHARFASDAGLPVLEMGDTALMRDAARRARYVLDGAGEVLLIRIDPVPGAAVIDDPGMRG